MSPDVQPRFKGTDTATGARPWSCKYGRDPCTRSEPCARCRGARSRRKGQTKQRAAAKQLAVPKSRYASQQGHEENLRGPLRIEAKAGKQVGPIETRYLKAERQSEEQRPVGDSRPFVMAAMPDGWGSDGLALVRLSRLVETAYAIVAAGGAVAPHRGAP